jgi:alpha-galactosidase/6-phospho-beta-glucosidase family protein
MNDKTKSLTIQMRIFQDHDNSGHSIIKMAWLGKDHITWVTDFEGSEKRYHPNLYRKLKDTLVNEGKWVN